jgi:hypothetical protein
MADETVTDGAAVDEGAGASGKPVTGPVGLEEARAARAAKLATARVGLAKMAGVTPPAEVDAEKTADPKPAIAKPVEKVDEKPAEVDPNDAKGLEAIEKRDQRARTQLAADKAAWKAEQAAELAAINKLKAELTGKASSLDELRKLAKTKPLEALKHLGVETEDDYERYARETYAVSKSGKADPKNKVYADQVAEKQGLAAELAELRKMVEDTRTHVSTREQQAQAEQFQAQYLDAAVKAIPADPSFIGLAHTANPGKARAALLALGQRMEREALEANDGEWNPAHTPSHAQVIAKYEEETRAELKDRGLHDDQIAAMLRKPGTAAPVVKTPPKTLDITTRPTTNTLNGNPTREQKIAAARAGRLKLQAEST